MGVDPRDKVLVFSDGLDLEQMLRIADRFSGRVKVAFGWGTNLTNDLGPDALSLVVKLAEVNGRPTVKLSDNRAKAMGEADEVERYRRVFGAAVTGFQECHY